MLETHAKALRAKVIAIHLARARLPKRVVCLTCGNAAAALRDEGLDVIEVGGHGTLQPTRWLEYHEIARLWPGVFDATSGHLPWPLMLQLAELLQLEVGPSPANLHVPSGSGETVVALALAYPHLRFMACYDDRNPATTYHPDAPLNRLVELLCTVHRVQ